MAHPSTYKPSPLSYGSPRTSPFRRPESPSPSPSTTIRATTPTPLASPTKPLQTPLTSPSKLHQSSTTPTSDTTSRGLTPQPSPTRTSSVSTAITPHHPSNHPRPSDNNNNNKSNTNDSISLLSPSHLRSMREAFQILDRNNDGLLTPSDVTTMLTQLSLPSDPSSTTPYFPPGAPQTLPLPTFLSTLSSLLAPLSSQAELLNAFAAFDERDSGEVDVGELRDALLHTSPEVGGKGLSGGEVEEAMVGFVGRRAFGREMVKGGAGERREVFRYREWVGGVMGGGEEKGEGKE